MIFKIENIPILRCLVKNKDEKYYNCYYIGSKNTHHDSGYYDLIESKEFKNLKKSECENCKEFTYCADYGYNTIVNSDLYNFLERITISEYIFTLCSMIWKSYQFNLCRNCKNYIE